MNIDTYLVADDKQTLASFCSYFRNVIGITSGVAEQPQQELDDGTILPAEPAKGNPDQYYACIRAPFSITPPDGVAVCDEDIGRDVVGVWA